METLTLSSETLFQVMESNSYSSFAKDHCGGVIMLIWATGMSVIG